MIKAVCLISGEGTNLQAILKHIQRKDLSFEITSIFCDKPNANGLKFSKELNIKNNILDFKKYDSIEKYDHQLELDIRKENPDIVLLSGYMRILSESFCNFYSGRIINIHPSLLPKLKGLNTYQRALLQKEKYHGSSVHLVVNELDSGAVIMQFRTKIKSDDTVSSLSKRVKGGEYIIYPRVIEYLANNELEIKNQLPYLFGEELTEPITIDDF